MIKTRSTICDLTMDMFPDNPGLIVDIRSLLAVPEVCAAVNTAIISCEDADLMDIHNCLIEGLSSFVFHREQKSAIAGKTLESLLGYLARVISAFVRIRAIQDPSSN